MVFHIRTCIKTKSIQIYQIGFLDLSLAVPTAIDLVTLCRIKETVLDPRSLLFQRIHCRYKTPAKVCEIRHHVRLTCSHYKVRKETYCGPQSTRARETKELN